MADDFRPDALAGLQVRVTTLLLAQVAEAGFVLAGAGAIRQHGFTERPTQDVDLFTGPATTRDEFQAAVATARRVLIASGFEVTVSRAADFFARLHLSERGQQILEVDFGINWRADAPVMMSVGPVLSERDAVAGKLAAVYSRGEVRDYLDLDSIRMSGRYTDGDLLALGREHDEGFEVGLFAAQLSQLAGILPTQALEYGVTADAFTEVQDRTLAWAIELRDAGPPTLARDAVERERQPVPRSDFGSDLRPNLSRSSSIRRSEGDSPSRSM